MFKEIRNFKVNRIIEKGIGPFNSEFIVNFLRGNCAHCDIEIPISSMLGNSLVVKKNKVQLLCVGCRTNGKLNINYKDVIPSDMFYGPAERDRIIIQMKKYVSKNNPKWIQILLTLRTNYFYLQGSSIPSKAFSVKFSDSPKDCIYRYDPIYQISDYQKPVTEIYGNILGISSCGECGTFWGKREAENDRRREKIIQNQCCWKCQIPNTLQWHMRETFKSEYEKLDGI